MYRCVYLQRRCYSLASRLRSLVLGKSNKETALGVEEKLSRPVAPPLASLEKTEQHLRLLAGNKALSLVPLTDINVKTKILLNCEKELGRTVACSDLGSLQTLDDLWSLFSSQPHYEARRAVVSEGEEELFPSLKNIEFPANLSVQLPQQQPKIKRMPFQNFDNPKHFNFQHKKKKRRFGYS